MKEKDPIKALLEVYERHMPETAYLVRNKERYDEIVSAMEDIEAFISSIEESATFEIQKDELVGTSLGLVVNCTLLSFTEIDKFCEAIKKVDAIDFTALTDGTLEIVFGFNKAYVAAPPHRSKIS